MRKTSVLFATLGLVIAGALFPASAQASEACDTAWRNASSGYFYAYDYVDCSGMLGSSQGDDPNWHDGSGGFRADDWNKAHSLLHKGTSGLAVKVYRWDDYTGNWSCIKKSEFYVSSLNGDYLRGGTGSYRAWNSIDSHKWVREDTCDGEFLH